MQIQHLSHVDPRWEIRRGHGPVLATALHAGHELRSEIANLSALDDHTRLRDEDPLTDVLASVGDHLFVPRASRFEIDLNRPDHEAVYLDPSYAWNLDLWKHPLPQQAVETSLAAREGFYVLMANWIEELIATHGRVLLLDVHSFNHRPGDGPGKPGPPTDDPDIDLGLTTADRDRFGNLIDTLWTTLEKTQVEDENGNVRNADVRANIRFEDGGHWPEWVFAEYGEHVCTITLEYKKAFMDEWKGSADIAALHRLHTGLARAVDLVRPLLS